MHTHDRKDKKLQKGQIPLSPAVQSAVDAFRSAGEETDPQGWYTGLPDEARKNGVLTHPMADHPTPGATQFVTPNQYEQPTQDADDL